MEPKAITVTLVGREYPLCLTVAAMEQISDLCGGLENVGRFISGMGNDTAEISASRAAAATAKVLGVLIEEGEENRCALASVNGEAYEPCITPSQFDVPHLMRPSDIARCQEAIMDAILQGMGQTVQVDTSKNVESARPD